MPTKSTIDGYPDLTEDWRAYMAQMGSAPLISEWTFTREAVMIFMRSRSVTEIRGWVAMAGQLTPLAYRVRIYRTDQTGRHIGTEILGAARPDLPVTIRRDDEDEDRPAEVTTE